MDDCKPLFSGSAGTALVTEDTALLWTDGRQGLTLVHVRAQLAQLQDTFMS